MRTFVAVEIAESVRRRAAELVELLRAARADVKWVEPHNMHLTLKFLDEVPLEAIAGVSEAVQQAVASVEPLVFETRGAGAFPSIGRPRTIWLGAGEGEDALVALQSAVDRALRKLGFPKESRRYEPHLTLGRVRGGGPAVVELARLLRGQIEFDAGRSTIDQVVVFASHLSPQGPTYEALSRVPLGM